MRIINPDGSIRFSRFKKNGEWFRFVGSNTIKKESSGELYDLSWPRIVEIEADEVDGEVVVVLKKDTKQLLDYYRTNYKTVQILYK